MSATTSGPAAPAAATPEANKALVRRVFEEIIPAGDTAAMLEVMDPDFLDHDPLPGQPAGGAGGAYVVTTMHTAHPDLRFHIDDLVAERDRVTIRWTMHATNTGPMLGRPPTGLPVRLAAVVIFRIAGGRLAERWAGWKPGFAPGGPGPGRDTGSMADRPTLVRRSYAAFAAGDRDAMEALLADDLTFSSPADVGIDRTAWFERCWPGHATIDAFDLVRLHQVGEEVVATYEATRTDGSRFRNTEVFGFAGDRIATVEVYFGWNL
jgi:ketosteroid isomerase-like protein